ncbi:hypothetical protein JAB1_17980 [Janthinobacterium sp. MP5059B]|uniref:NMCC_0638 family (lipo)protein n=1 Tax=Janthinobacterium sp. MP5059B TaxID=1766683 RepID=UPI0008750FCD|nr:hypothetical protein [Janthinobacterium sp. MP5059B]OEZ50680.1 hypothetical protein JAB1_17980 [Janthinobacterium sp. MP5059B]
MKKIVAALLLFVSPFAACASPKASELATAQVVDEFVQGCFMNFPYPEKFQAWLARPGFQKLSSIDAAAYLGAYSGNAWNVQLDNSRFVLTSIGESACNVFANDLDASMTRNLVIGFLDYLKTQGATYQSKMVTPASATASLSSTSYAVSMNGQVIMHLALTIAAPGTGPFQVALTAARAET